MIREVAPAKINLYLHVGPVRADGYHALQSLFVFTQAGDAIVAEDAEDLTLRVRGPFAGALDRGRPQDNLVWKAAALLREEFNVRRGAALTLEKNLPVAAGIGGGSADAAAALRALSRLWEIDASDDRMKALAFSLGADVPACLSGAPAMVSGAGECVEPGPALPPLWACLANPGVAMATGPVFKAFDAAAPSPPTPTAPPVLLGRSGEQLTRQSLDLLMAQSRNDLEAPALTLEPEIAAARDALAACEGALAARMSGSGATVFALFAAAPFAHDAEKVMRARGWWALASPLISG